MTPSPRTLAAQDAALIGKFLLWAHAIQDLDGVILVGPDHKAAIDAASKHLYRLMRREKARTRPPRHRKGVSHDNPCP